MCKSLCVIAGLALAIFSKTLMASDYISYDSQTNKTDMQAVAYESTHDSPLRYLAYRDIPYFLSKYVNGDKALDNGSGTGFSLEFLQRHGFEVVGADISKEMIARAQFNVLHAPIHFVENGTLPLPDNSYDLVFSSMVLFEIGCEEDMLKYLEETKRVMKLDGICIAITGSQDVFCKNWLDLDVDYPENKHIHSGGIAKSLVISAGIEFTDYYWTEEDYRQFFSKAGLQLLEVYYPLGYDTDPYKWKDEIISSPYVILIAKKDAAIGD